MSMDLISRALAQKAMNQQTSGVTQEQRLSDKADYAIYVTPEMYGAIGDGITDDRTSIQQALDSGKTVYFNSSKTYLCRSTLNVTGITGRLYFNGCTLKKGCYNHLINFDNMANFVLSNVNISDDGLSEGGVIRGLNLFNFTMSNVHIIQTTTFVVNGGWCITLSGENINISNIYLNNFECGRWFDGFHFGYVKNLFMDDLTIYSGDDSIAFFQQVANGTFTFTGAAMNTPSENIFVSNCVIKSKMANGIRIGCDDSGLGTIPLHCVRKVKFQNIQILPDSKYCVRFEDLRSATTNKYDDLIFDSITFKGTNTTDYAPIYFNGKNFIDTITFKNCKCDDSTSLTFANLSFNAIAKVILSNLSLNNTIEKGTIPFISAVNCGEINIVDSHLQFNSGSRLYVATGVEKTTIESSIIKITGSSYAPLLFSACTATMQIIVRNSVLSCVGDVIFRHNTWATGITNISSIELVNSSISGYLLSIYNAIFNPTTAIKILNDNVLASTGVTGVSITPNGTIQVKINGVTRNLLYSNS